MIHKMLFITLLFSLLAVKSVFAQQIKVPVKKEESKKTTPATPKNAASDKLTLKICPNLKCILKIDGEDKGTIEADDVLKVDLKKGTFMIKAISSENAIDYYNEEFTVIDVNTEKVLKIDLKKIRDARLSKEKTEINVKNEIQNNANTIIDSRDGKIYKTVKIGVQTWMAENLAYKPNSGNYWAYNNMLSYIKTYGYLYDWETAKTVCPSGWHLPSDIEWTKLEREICTSASCDKEFPLDGSKWGFRGTNEGCFLKETGTTFWKNPNSNANNSSGFTALPGGNYIQDKFGTITIIGDWWSATSINEKNAWGRGLYYDRSTIDRNVNEKGNGFSVRCIKD